MIRTGKLLMILVFTLSFSTAFSQMPTGGGNRGGMGGQNMNMGHFYGMFWTVRMANLWMLLRCN